MSNLLTEFSPYIKIIVVLGLLYAAHWFVIKRHPELGAEKKLPRQIMLFLLTLVAIVFMILVAPISEATRGQIFSLVGLVFTGIIALSSTTFVTNAMAGLMLRLVNTFKPGDYLRIDQTICRVTERGLFHTEVQNEDKELVTYPNLFLVSNQVTVISQAGALVSCTISLGYEVPHNQVEKILCKAATHIGLDSPFVLVKALNDFSIVYKISGFLSEVKNLVTWRSNLHISVLDHLHDQKIEIVSPNQVISRAFPVEHQFIAQNPIDKSLKINKADQSVEEKLFDKAEDASEEQLIRDEMARIAAQIENASSDEVKSHLQSELLSLEQKLLKLIQ
jgi:small conductance mechanosensitive channel